MVSSSNESILIVVSDAQISLLLERVLRATNAKILTAQDCASARNLLSSSTPNLVVMAEQLDDGNGLEFSAEILRQIPTMAVILFVYTENPETLKKAMRIGINDYLCLPLRGEDILNAVNLSLERVRRRRDWGIQETKKVTSSLQSQVDEMTALAQLGRQIASSLELDGVLTSVVEAAVKLTRAEEGSLLLIDEKSGELYMRAARNFQEDFVRTFRLPVQDTLAGAAVRTGQPVLVDEETPQKIKTSYLVHSLVYVPLQLKGRSIGVLGVDNRRQTTPFKERDVKVLSTLADYAVLAIENARLYVHSIQERQKLETVIAHIQDGVVVVDKDMRLVLVNQVALMAFNLPLSGVVGQPFVQHFPQPELKELLESTTGRLANRVEVSLEDGRVFSARIASIPGVGRAITLHDITYLKKLDHIKSDFVSTVSHDLRSPLTAILGYAELIERIGPLSEMQREFLHRVQISVHNITSLVDDLLNLGRIEAGFDSRKERVALDQLIRFSVDNLSRRSQEKNQTVSLDLSTDFPLIFANPVQIRSVVDNLIDNAIKYTPNLGIIRIRCAVEQNQVIFQVTDSGIGIPATDLPYIFDKFYRASNVNADQPGTGLGLAIVKSIVENHQGRIWVDSTPEQGSTFTVVFPLAEDR
jgi:two-component system NtrC family sensor kinase